VAGKIRVAAPRPRGVLAEFGVTLADDVEVRVWDSTAELRYLVLPERPPGSEELGEEALAALVTREVVRLFTRRGSPAMIRAREVDWS
jgi:nitrile hydratase subunit alpha